MKRSGKDEKTKPARARAKDTCCIDPSALANQERGETWHLRHELTPRRAAGVTFYILVALQCVPYLDLKNASNRYCPPAFGAPKWKTVAAGCQFGFLMFLGLE